ncbi:MAG: hypothetical protein FWC10_02660 [Lentimicrobiaceae bacterium]|nr:hypothetical protein [Lentimicrobiaceae bacterium]
MILLLKNQINLNNLTLKSQEAIAQAQLVAHSQKHLIALIEVDVNVVPYLLKKLDANPKMILQNVEK